MQCNITLRQCLGETGYLAMRNVCMFKKEYNHEKHIRQPQKQLLYYSTRAFSVDGPTGRTLLNIFHTFITII